MYNQAKTWNCRPSVLADITEAYHAFCFDEAVATWGTYVTNELEKIEGKKAKEVERKRHNKLLQLLGAPPEVRFRSMRPSTAAGKRKKGGD